LKVPPISWTTRCWTELGTRSRCGRPRPGASLVRGAAAELARILCAWGEVEDADEADFAFVTDASLNDSGHRLNELIMAMRLHPDEAVLRQRAASLGRGGLQLPPLDVVRRVQILSRMGTADSVLAQVEMRILALLSRVRLATPEDAVNATNALMRRLFIVGGDIDLSRRTVSRGSGSSSPNSRKVPAAQAGG